MWNVCSVDNNGTFLVCMHFVVKIPKKEKKTEQNQGIQIRHKGVLQAYMYNVVCIFMQACRKQTDCSKSCLQACPQACPQSCSADCRNLVRQFAASLSASLPHSCPQDCHSLVRKIAAVLSASMPQSWPQSCPQVLSAVLSARIGRKAWTTCNLHFLNPASLLQASQRASAMKFL